MLRTAYVLTGDPGDLFGIVVFGIVVFEDVDGGEGVARMGPAGG